MNKFILIGLLLMSVVAQAETKFEVLNKINFDLQTNTAAATELNLDKDFGEYKGRCYQPENPDRSLGMILSIRPFKDETNGPRFARSGIRAFLILNTGGSMQTDNLTQADIDSVLYRASDDSLNDAEISIWNPKYAEFTIYPKPGLEARAIMVKAKSDGYIYVSAYVGNPTAVQSCYFWTKRNP